MELGYASAQGRAARGAAAAGLIALAAIAAFSAGRSGAAAASDKPAAIGEARQASVTVNLPEPVTQRVYAPPGTQGRPIIVIDAGHGGRDPGATSTSGEAREKDLTLELARQVRDALLQRGRVRVALSREDDRYYSLDERAALARNVGAALFVSLHTDSAPNPLARGASVYSLSDVASDAEAARLAAAQNAGTFHNERGGSNVSVMLADLAMRSEMNASANFAARLVGKSSGRFGLREEPHRFAAFHVLRRAGVPAVLFEAGYISNVDDEKLLRSAAHRAKIALALAQAIEADVAARTRR